MSSIAELTSFFSVTSSISAMRNLLGTSTGPNDPITLLYVILRARSPSSRTFLTKVTGSFVRFSAAVPGFSF